MGPLEYISSYLFPNSLAISLHEMNNGTNACLDGTEQVEAGEKDDLDVDKNDDDNDDKDEASSDIGVTVATVATVGAIYDLGDGRAGFAVSITAFASCACRRRLLLWLSSKDSIDCRWKCCIY